jgi:hypothetical protein
MYLCRSQIELQPMLDKANQFVGIDLIILLETLKGHQHSSHLNLLILVRAM